jgi:hypothetical protein
VIASDTTKSKSTLFDANMKNVSSEALSPASIDSMSNMSIQTSEEDLLLYGTKKTHSTLYQMFPSLAQLKIVAVATNEVKERKQERKKERKKGEEEEDEDLHLY